MPYTSTTDHTLGNRLGSGEPRILSAPDGMGRSFGLMAAVNCMLDRCEDTMLHTSRNLLCWLRSTIPQTCYPKPFALVSLPESKTKYRRCFQRFTAFASRAFRIPPDARQRLVKIRHPAVSRLQRERDSYFREVLPTRLLFRYGRDLDPPWGSSRLTAMLRKATTEVWGLPANSQLYRQLTIGITEKHVQEVHKPFNRFDDVGARANRKFAYAWQSGHRRATMYELDGAFPASLQPALLRLYEWLSVQWHEFLHQPSCRVEVQAKQTAPAPAVARAVPADKVSVQPVKPYYKPARP